MSSWFMRTVGAVVCALLLSGTLSGCGDDSVEGLLAKAKSHLAKKDTQAAVIELKTALQKSPDSGEARYLLGTALLQEGNASAAEVELRKALAAKHPADVVVPDLARAMLAQGKHGKLVDEFAKTRFEQPAAQASLQVSLAMAYAVLGKPEPFASARAAALAADPVFAPAVILNARHKATTGDFDGALALVADVLAREPGNVDAWKLKGEIYSYALNKPEDAIAAYRKALESDPKFLPAHFDLLNLLLRQNKLDEAGKQLDQLKKFAAQNPQTLFFAVQLAYQNKDFKLARELAQKLLQLVPKNPRALQLAGTVELQMGALAQAESLLTRATQAAPELALARRLLLLTYSRSGQTKKALAALESDLGKNEIDPAIYSVAGEIYLQNGDAKKAEEYFAKALKLDPDDLARRTALAMVQIENGQSTQGMGELAGIAASDKSVSADLALISAHVQRNEWDQALAAIDKLEAKQPDRPIAATLRGRIQLAQKDRAAARKSFERALTIAPEYFAATTSLAAMDLSDKKPDDAKRRYEALLAKNPKNGPALLALAELSAANGAGKDEVAALLTRAVDANPTDALPRQSLIDLYLRHQDYKQALVTAQNAVAALPSSLEMLYALGRAQQLSGDRNQAAGTFSKLMALQPLAPQPHIRLAEVQLAKRDNAAARQSLRKALEIAPKNLEAQRALIALNLAEGKPAEARKVAITVQEQRPQAPEGFIMEGDIANLQKNWALATSAYRAAVQRGASSETAVKLHAVVVASGKPAEADAFAATWVKEHPKDALFLAYQGQRALARKDLAAAEKHYLAALQITPDNPIVLNNLAWVTGQLGKAGAVDFAEKANKLSPNQPVFMDTLAMLLADKNEFSRAIDLLNQALGLQPANAGLRLSLAKVYVKSGDKVRAKSELEALARLGSRFPAQAEVTALLKPL